MKRSILFLALFAACDSSPTNESVAPCVAFSVSGTAATDTLLVIGFEVGRMSGRRVLPEYAGSIRLAICPAGATREDAIVAARG